MIAAPFRRARSAFLALLAGVAGIPSVAVAASGGAGLGPHAGGGAPAGGLDPAPVHKRKPPSKLGKGKWLRGVSVTEYWPVPEWWFVGRLVGAPGLSGKHHLDWLYSATGVSMQGEGIGLDGRLYHIASLGNDSWVTSEGNPTSPATGGWSGGPPYWRAGDYWLSRSGVTYPLQSRGWSNGRGVKYVPLRGVSFALGPSLPLRFYQSIAVDPSVIPLGSRVYVPAYRDDGHGGWFIAQDTGGAIIGRHIDVYRSPPAAANDPGLNLARQRVYVIPRRR